MISIIFYIFLAGILFYTAILYNSSALVLLVFAEMALVLLALCCLVYWRLVLRFEVEIPIAVSEVGRKSLISVKCRNAGPFVCPRVRLCMVCRNTLQQTVQKKWLKASDLLPGNSAVDHYLRLPAPGNYEVELKRVRLYDLTGLVFLQFSGKRGRGISAASVIVLPQIHAVGVRVSEAVRNFYGESDVYDEDKGGLDNSEIFRIRPFADGDKIRSIHWKLSARTDELMVKEYSLPRACAVVLLLDFHRSRRVRPDVFFTAAASISFALMDAGCAHYVAWYEEKTKNITRVRVDGEENFYLFLNCYMKDYGEGFRGSLAESYREKYRGESFVHTLRLTEEPALYRDGEKIAGFSAGKLEEELGGTEIVL